MPWAREQAQCLHCKPPETHLAGSVLPVTRKPCPFLYGLPPPSISRESDEYGRFCSHQCSIILNHQQFLPRPVLISIVTCSISSAVPPSPAPSRPMASRLFHSCVLMLLSGKERNCIWSYLMGLHRGARHTAVTVGYTPIPHMKSCFGDNEIHS